MVNLSTLYPTVRRFTPGVPKQIMLESLRRAFRNFCEDTGAYIETRLVSTTKGQSDYLLDLPEKTHVETILEARGEGARKFLNVYHNTTMLKEDDSQNEPYNVAVNDLNEVRFYPIPDDTYIYRFRVHLRPDPDCSEMSNDLYRKYGEAIAFGACEELLLLPEQTWTNPNMSLVMSEKLQMKINEAKTEQVNASGGVLTRGFA